MAFSGTQTTALWQTVAPGLPRTFAAKAPGVVVSTADTPDSFPLVYGLANHRIETRGIADYMADTYGSDPHRTETKGAP